jgi:hypothetical protein
LNGAGTATYTVDLTDEDVVLEGDDVEEAKVYVTFAEQDGNYGSGAIVQVSTDEDVTENNPDYSWSAEGEDELDIDGTYTSEEHTLSIDDATIDSFSWVANSTGTLTVSSPGIGYNLVLPMAQALKLPGAKQGEVEKVEGPNKVKVPSVTTTAPLSQFASDELTVIVRPKKDEAGAVIPNEYIVLSAFPGDPDIPRASEWGGKFAVIIPGGEQQQENNINESILGVIALGATIGMGWNWITKKKKQLDKASAIADKMKGREDEKKKEEAKIAAQEAALAQVETFLKDPKNQEVINKIKNDPEIKRMTAELDQDYNKEYDSWERSGGQGMFSQGPSPWWGMGKESVVKQIEAKMKELGGEQLLNLLATSGQGIRGLK